MATEKAARARWLLAARRVVLGMALVLVLLPFSFWVCCPTTGSLFEWKYRYRVRVGMTVGEVEAILGRGERQEWVGWTPDGEGGMVPFVRGDEFLLWEEDGLEIWTGIRDGKVCDKQFWASSL